MSINTGPDYSNTVTRDQPLNGLLAKLNMVERGLSGSGITVLSPKAANLQMMQIFCEFTRHMDRLRDDHAKRDLIVTKDSLSKIQVKWTDICGKLEATTYSVAVWAFGKYEATEDDVRAVVANGWNPKLDLEAKALERATTLLASFGRAPASPVAPAAGSGGGASGEAS